MSGLGLPALFFVNIALGYMLWVIARRVAFLEDSDRKLWRNELMRRSHEQKAKRYKGNDIEHHCCYILEDDHSPCHRAAQFIIYYSGEGYYDYTHSCVDHVHLMIDAYNPSYVYPIEKDEPG